MIAVIMAGGKGTRIREIDPTLPKPMLPVGNKPILEREIEALKAQNVEEIVLVIGYLGEKIEAYFRGGEAFGVKIRYIREKEPLGTAGALYFLKDIKEDFLLLCGDLLFDVDLGRFLAFHRAHRATATVLSHPNSHPYDSGVIVTDEEGKVVRWLHKEEPRGFVHNNVNAGLHILSPKIFENFGTLQKSDLDRDILRPLIPRGELFAYRSPEYVFDLGTPDRLLLAERDLASGKVHSKNLSVRQRAIFLDRDGTINEYVGFLHNIDSFTLIDGAAEAIRKINESGYLAIVVTNQPVIARGEVTLSELDEIHCKMETLLGEKGAYVDEIYFCPHHPDRGFAGERPEFKIVCNCRKPKPGMLLSAAEKFNIDLSASWFIGDRETDLLCGKNAGCRVAFIGNDARADYSCPDLLHCVECILKENP